MNKEYFKILKEINSLEKSVEFLESENQEESARVEKLRAKEQQAQEEVKSWRGDLKSKRLEAQKNENLISALDTRLAKAQADARSSFDSKHVEALEREIEKLNVESEEAQDLGLEILESLEELEAHISEKENFLKGITETIEEIKVDVDEVCAKNQNEIEIKRKRISSALELLPENFKTAYQSVQKKRLPVSSFTKITAGKCAVCKMSVDKTKEAQVEEQLAIKTCSSCGRIFIPNQALY